MEKTKDGIYKPIDKITGVSWNFIKLVCDRHEDARPKLILGNGSGGPCYRCEKADCAFTFPAAVHERLIDEVVKILNKKGSVIGYTWRKQILSHVYSFEILEYDYETGVTVGVNRLQ